MAANTSPIFPVAPIVGIAALISGTTTALTSRANISGTTGLAMLTAASTNGTRIDSITVKCNVTSVASIVCVWIFTGSTGTNISYLFDEIDVVATTASTTVDGAVVTRTYSTLTLPPTYQLYISETVQTNLTVFAFGGVY